MKEKFINIHTHFIENQENIWQITSLFPEQEILDTPFSIGIHPWKITENWQESMQEVVRKSQFQNCIAIGECGLDKTVKMPLEFQKEIFKEHIYLANELQKPLVVHCVKAYDELLKILPQSKVPVILHDFGKSVDLGKQLQQKGLFLSVGKAVFRPSFQNVLPQLDRQLLFFETDDMECSVVEIYEQVAQMFNCDLLTLQRQIYRNFKKIF